MCTIVLNHLSQIINHNDKYNNIMYKFNLFDIYLHINIK